MVADGEVAVAAAAEEAAAATLVPTPLPSATVAGD